MDLGLAVDLDSVQNGRFVGTAAYLAPECLLCNEKNSYLSDMYALGVVLYYALSGHLPIQGGDIHELAYQAIVHAPSLPIRAESKRERMLVKIIMGLISEQQKRRFTARGLKAKLEELKMGITNG